jgi:hypothetical protein
MDMENNFFLLIIIDFYLFRRPLKILFFGGGWSLAGGAFRARGSFPLPRTATT